MSIYGQSILNEAFLFISDNGKQKKNKIKEICKETKEKKSIMQKMTGRYDKAIAEKTVNKIKKEFDSFYMGPVIERVTTSSSGAVSTDYYSDCTAISKNYVYSVKLFFMTDRCYLSTFTEEDMNKFNYPKDIVEFAIKNATGKNSLLINKKYIKIVDVDSSIFNRNINPEVSAIQKYVESKHKDLTFNIKPNTISFK